MSDLHLGCHDECADVVTLSDGNVLVMLRREMDTDDISFKSRPSRFIQALIATQESVVDTEPEGFHLDGTKWRGEVIYFAPNSVDQGGFSLRLVNGPPYGFVASLRKQGVFVLRMSNESRLNLITALSNLPTA